MDFDDFEYPYGMLRELRKLGDAFEEQDEFLEQPSRYQATGWPFGRETKAFLMWVEFGQESTIN